MIPISSRRRFLGGAASAFLAASRAFAAKAEADLPLVDYHVHLNPTFSLEDALAL